MNYSQLELANEIVHSQQERDVIARAKVDEAEVIASETPWDPEDLFEQDAIARDLAEWELALSEEIGLRRSPKASAMIFALAAKYLWVGYTVAKSEIRAPEKRTDRKFKKTKPKK